MAQKLKDETRTAIIDAARKEFLEKGYEDASMRNIAANAGITVGNIYRYFDSKEELSRYIMSSSSDKMKKLLDSLKIERLSKEPRVFDTQIDLTELTKMMDSLSYGFVRLYDENEEDFQILLNDPSLNKMIKNWFEDTFRKIILPSYMTIDRSREKEVLCHAYAVAVFDGLKEIFAESYEDREELYSIVRTYLENFMKMVYQNEENRKYR